MSARDVKYKWAVAVSLRNRQTLVADITELIAMNRDNVRKGISGDFAIVNLLTEKDAAFAESKKWDDVIYRNIARR